MEYRLTEKGTEFVPVLVALMQWGTGGCGPPGRVAPSGLRPGGHAELRCENDHRVPADAIDLVAKGE